MRLDDFIVNQAHRSADEIKSRQDKEDAKNGQTHLGSVIESVANIVFGFGVAVWANTVVLPWFGFKCSTHQALGIGLIFTAISFVRSYIFRRVFNWIQVRWGL